MVLTLAVASVAGLLIAAFALLVLVPDRWEKANSITPPHRWRDRALQRLQRRRLLVLIYLGVVALIALVLVVWVLPLVLTRHPQLDDPAERHKAITDTRTGLVAMLAAIGAAGGLAFTARTYRLSRQGQITDRYSRAVEHLATDKIDVRLGGIYALERLMRDSPADQPTIVELLAAYVRQHSPAEVAQPCRKNFALWRQVKSIPESLDQDIQAILTVLGRRHRVPGEDRVDLQDTNLAGADVQSLDLSWTNFGGANLSRVKFGFANLLNSDLGCTDLTNAYFGGARFDGVTMMDADLTGTTFNGTDLGGAYMSGSSLTRARLIRVKVAGAALSEGALTKQQLDEVDGAEDVIWM